MNSDGRIERDGGVSLTCVCVGRAAGKKLKWKNAKKSVNAGTRGEVGKENKR